MNPDNNTSGYDYERSMARAYRANEAYLAGGGDERLLNHPAENVKSKCEYDWCEECKYREKFIKVGNEMVCENCYNIAMAEIDTRIGDEALDQQGEGQ